MNLALPERGSVIRYAYLWADEYRHGHEEARKDRPALVLTLTVQNLEGRTEVLVLAITHHPPADSRDAVALPTTIKRRLKLDDDASWIVTAEANIFTWPGPDLRPVPGRSPPTVIYGKIPASLLQEVARSFLDNRKRQLGQLIPRSQ